MIIIVVITIITENNNLELLSLALKKEFISHLPCEFHDGLWIYRFSV